MCADMQAMFVDNDADHAGRQDVAVWQDQLGGRHDGTLHRLLRHLRPRDPLLALVQGRLQQAEQGRGGAGAGAEEDLLRGGGGERAAGGVAGRGGRAAHQCRADERAAAGGGSAQDRGRAPAHKIFWRDIQWCWGSANALWNNGVKSEKMFYTFIPKLYLLILSVVGFLFLVLICNVYIQLNFFYKSTVFCPALWFRLNNSYIENVG